MASDTTQLVQIEPRYDPSQVERRWYEEWERRGLFHPDLRSDAERFVITIPPPNVTGELHMGHALTYGIEDILGRFKRMQGFNTLILPGTDHAGIATQNVVEKQLAAEGLTRHEIGRERFLERVWKWKEEYADNIRQQFRALGCSFDWSLERFTMDADYANAVLEAFIRLFNEGKIYRGWRVINWCVRCHSAISDIEVEAVEREDQLYYIRYPVDGEKGEIVVATVRPETILGDVAVAVNPRDARYKHLVGKIARLPLLDRPLRIVADEMVDMSFGTGAVKITPAHDFADFEVAERHELDRPIAIGPDARITEVGGPYQGQSVDEARQSILRDLDSNGYLVKTEAYEHNVPTCERCGTVLEPLLSEQWFMDMKELAQPAIDVVKHGPVTFVPERWSEVYLDWMANLRPWTLSRQLWWGHRIPIYFCANGHAVASKDWPHACSQCQASIERQDPDVLDTWFSSALWPFATLGWPQETVLLRKFYPTSFMNTSSQILYLWIARMVMMGLHFLGDVPFPTVLINPTILNKHGQRMSKSLGTGIDPLDLVQQYGADALRFGLMTSGSTHQQDIRFAPERVERSRNFANKVWNIARLILTNQQESEQGELHLSIADRWILSRLSSVTANVTTDLDAFEFSGAGQKLYDFLWNEVADWYVEMAKLRLHDDSNPHGQYSARAVLWSILDRSLRLLHPHMPFITEEIWQRVRVTGSASARDISGWQGDLPDCIMSAPWPAVGPIDRPAEESVRLVMDVVRAIRAARSEHGADPGKIIPATLVAGSQLTALQGMVNIVSRLARVEPLTVCESLPEKPSEAVALIVRDVTVYMSLHELADVAAERKRIQRELENVEKALHGVESKLHNPAFKARAPEHVVAQEQDRAGGLLERVRRLRERLSMLSE